MFVTAQGLSSCATTESCWPLRVGETYEVELRAVMPDTGRASCGPEFDLAVGNRFRVRVDRTQVIDDCKAFPDSSILEAELGAVTLELESSLRSAAGVATRTEYLVLWNGYPATRTGTLEEIAGQPTITSPGCSGVWSFSITSPKQPNALFSPYDAETPELFLNRRCNGTCAGVASDCTDSWGVSLRVYDARLPADAAALLRPAP